jgi:hypothetical protein
MFNGNSNLKGTVPTFKSNTSIVNVTDYIKGTSQGNITNWKEVRTDALPEEWRDQLS